MTTMPVVRISRISFQSDMTRGDAPVIPFARILECVWPDVLRWVGLIGRTRLMPLELDAINLETWPEFREPHALLSRLWDEGWNAEWGLAGAALETVWGRSALSVVTEPLAGLLPDCNHSDADAALIEAHPILWARMLAEENHLKPKLIAPVTEMRLRQPTRVQPTAARSETALAEAA
ncbi:MAG TPA: hypothetical protein VHT03_07940 [Rhizomicrobium sp.]|jgi:hypothetical protein|nr:hypothetical protein [Rhizomicrobium sp.]